ncbi:MAG: TIM barrel protein, partial [Syntrophobacteraceae bacterium]
MPFQKRVFDQVNLPSIAICNFIRDTAILRNTARQYGFSGVDWTFTLEDLPRNEIEEWRLLGDISQLKGLEVRYHCAFKGIDLGVEDDREAEAAMEIFQKVCRIVSRLDGRFMTVHLGLGRKSPEGLSWERTISALADLVAYG